jgi:hypothetical protein
MKAPIEQAGGKVASHKAELFFLGPRNRKFGPTQLSTHFEGVFDHGDKHDLVFSGLLTFLTRRVDSVDTVQGHCPKCLHALVGVTAHQKILP